MKRPRPIQALRHWFLHRNLDLYRDRYRVLEAAVELQREKASVYEEPLITVLSGRIPFDTSTLLTKLYGERALESDRFEFYWVLLELQLGSLVASGELGRFDVSEGSNDYYLTPKALSSLAQHQLELKKLWLSVLPVWAVATLTLVYVIFAALDYWHC